jgi:hypothetical protein
MVLINPHAKPLGKKFFHLQSNVRHAGESV